MKVSSSLSNINNSAKAQSFKGFVPTKLVIPEAVGNMAKVVGENVCIPEQKLLIAATAAMLHPVIDLKYGDEDTKIDAAAKSASKAIVGGLTGVAIRAAFISYFNKILSLDTNKYIKSSNNIFFPEMALKFEKQYGLNYAKHILGKYNSTLGTIFAILFMTFFSNKNIDVPLTNDLHDFITGIVKENKTWTKSLDHAISNRKAKISKKINNIKQKISIFTNKSKAIAKIILAKDAAVDKERSK